MSYAIDHVKGYVSINAYDFWGEKLGHDEEQSFNKLKMSDIGHIGLNGLCQKKDNWEFFIKTKFPIGKSEVCFYVLDYGKMTAENFEIRQADVDSIMLYFRDQLKGGESWLKKAIN